MGIYYSILEFMEKRFIKGKGKENVCEVNATKVL